MVGTFTKNDKPSAGQGVRVGSTGKIEGRKTEVNVECCSSKNTAKEGKVGTKQKRIGQNRNE